MDISSLKKARGLLLLFSLAVLLLAAASPAPAAIDGITGTTFDFAVKDGYISTAEGGSLYMWGYADVSAGGYGKMQYPGPTIIVNEGDTVTINLTNELTTTNVSMVFPGQSGVTATGGVPGKLTHEAAPSGGTVTYTFTASKPGTYMYYSGTDTALQTEMGLVGAIIVRPSMGANFAYNNAGTRFRDEFLFLLTEADPEIHQLVEEGKKPDVTKFFPVYWFINGRTAPDTMEDAFIGWLPHQPYNCMPMTQPYDADLNPYPVLLRLIGGGRDSHPFHTHGNHTRVIAKDGRLLEGPAGQDTSELHFTMRIAPGQTTDATFIWEGHRTLGWDVYGHKASDPANPGEGTNHGKPFPVTLPGQNETTFGPFYSGSPFLGQTGGLPPPDQAANLNPNGYFFFMWHSHSEKELTNFDVFPGGMLTMMFVEPLMGP